MAREMQEMSLSGWASVGATFAAAMVMGLGLGSYATTPQGRSPADERVAETEGEAGSAYAAQDLAMNGPTEVKCTGCGPTLEERRWRADMAGWDADGMIGESHDPVVRDYLADQPVEETRPAEPVQIEQLPANIVRFARGEPVEQPSPARGEDEQAPPAVIRTAAMP